MVMNPEELRAAGNWLEQLKKILNQGPAQLRDVGKRPEQDHRGTKKAVKLLLSNLRKGAGKTQDSDTTEQDIDKVVFNTVELLIDDKQVKSKKSMTRLQALAKFRSVLTQEFTAQSQKRDALDNRWKAKLEEALQALETDEFEKRYNQGEMTPEDMLGTSEGRRALADKPRFGGTVLSAVDPARLQQLNLDKEFGQAKDDVLAEALLAICKNNAPLKTGKELDRKTQFDPALFSVLATQLKPDVWNDKGPRKRGLGPRVCLALWRSGAYDKICELNPARC
jgi:hypothetical protein